MTDKIPYNPPIPDKDAYDFTETIGKGNNGNFYRPIKIPRRGETWNQGNYTDEELIALRHTIATGQAAYYKGAIAAKHPTTDRIIVTNITAFNVVVKLDSDPFLPYKNAAGKFITNVFIRPYASKIRVEAIPNYELARLGYSVSMLLKDWVPQCNPAAMAWKIASDYHSHFAVKFATFCQSAFSGLTSAQKSLTTRHQNGSTVSDTITHKDLTDHVSAYKFDQIPASFGLGSPYTYSIISGEYDSTYSMTTSYTVSMWAGYSSNVWMHIGNRISYNPFYFTGGTGVYRHTYSPGNPTDLCRFYRPSTVVGWFTRNVRPYAVIWTDQGIQELEFNHQVIDINYGGSGVLPGYTAQSGTLTQATAGTPGYIGSGSVEAGGVSDGISGDTGGSFGSSTGSSTSSTTSGVTSVTEVLPTNIPDITDYPTPGSIVITPTTEDPYGGGDRLIIGTTPGGGESIDTSQLDEEVNAISAAREAAYKETMASGSTTGSGGTASVTEVQQQYNNALEFLKYYENSSYRPQYTGTVNEESYFRMLQNSGFIPVTSRWGAEAEAAAQRQTVPVDSDPYVVHPTDYPSGASGTVTGSGTQGDYGNGSLWDTIKSAYNSLANAVSSLTDSLFPTATPGSLDDVNLYDIPDYWLPIPEASPADADPSDQPAGSCGVYPTNSSGEVIRSGSSGGSSGNSVSITTYSSTLISGTTPPTSTNYSSAPSPTPSWGGSQSTGGSWGGAPMDGGDTNDSPYGPDESDWRSWASGSWATGAPPAPYTPTNVYSPPPNAMPDYGADYSDPDYVVRVGAADSDWSYSSPTRWYPPTTPTPTTDLSGGVTPPSATPPVNPYVNTPAYDSGAVALDPHVLRNFPSHNLCIYTDYVGFGSVPLAGWASLINASKHVFHVGKFDYSIQGYYQCCRNDAYIRGWVEWVPSNINNTPVVGVPANHVLIHHGGLAGYGVCLYSVPSDYTSQCASIMANTNLTTFQKQDQIYAMVTVLINNFASVELIVSIHEPGEYGVVPYVDRMPVT